MKRFIPVLFFLLIFSFYAGCASVDSLVQDKKFDKADRYCNDQPRDKKKGCYNELGDSYFKYGHYTRAMRFYKKSGNKKKQKLVNSKLGDTSLEKGNYFLALNYYKSAKNKEDK